MMNKAALITCAAALISNYLEYRPGSEIAGSYGNSMFNFLRLCQTSSHSDFTILNFHEQYMSLMIFLFFSENQPPL